MATGKGKKPRLTEIVRSQRNPGAPEIDMERALHAVSPRIRKAVRTAHRALTEAGVRHAIVGGLAVGAHGVPRATEDIDFLVGNEAFHHHRGGVVTMREGVPIEAGGVRVDYLSPVDGTTMAAVLDAPVLSAGLPVVPIEALLYQKLLAFRPKDQGDILALLQAGVDLQDIRDYLDTYGTELLRRRFEKLVASVL